MPQTPATPTFKPWQFPLAAVLAWLIPGAGHFYLGLRKRALLLFVCIEATFFIGLYIGTVRIVDPSQSVFWFLAQILAGLNTIIANLCTPFAEGQTAGAAAPLIRDYSYSLGILYTGIAGLLNLLTVFDTLIRAGRANLGQAPLPAD